METLYTGRNDCYHRCYQYHVNVCNSPWNKCRCHCRLISMGSYQGDEQQTLFMSSWLLLSFSEKQLGQHLVPFIQQMSLLPLIHMLVIHCNISIQFIFLYFYSCKCINNKFEYYFASVMLSFIKLHYSYSLKWGGGDTRCWRRLSTILPLNKFNFFSGKTSMRGNLFLSRWADVEMWLQ